MRQYIVLTKLNYDPKDNESEVNNSIWDSYRIWNGLYEKQKCMGLECKKIRNHEEILHINL